MCESPRTEETKGGVMRLKLHREQFQECVRDGTAIHRGSLMSYLCKVTDDICTSDRCRAKGRLSNRKGSE